MMKIKHSILYLVLALVLMASYASAFEVTLTKGQDLGEKIATGIGVFSILANFIPQRWVKVNKMIAVLAANFRVVPLSNGVQVAYVKNQSRS